MTIPPQKDSRLEKILVMEDLDHLMECQIVEMVATNILEDIRTRNLFKDNEEDLKRCLIHRMVCIHTAILKAVATMADMAQEVAAIIMVISITGDIVVDQAARNTNTSWEVCRSHSMIATIPGWGVPV